MLHKAKTLKGYMLEGHDGKIGKVMGFYFDDQHWAIRYLVADTGNWLPTRLVLISPYALVAVTREELHIAIDLTKKQIEESPSLNSDKPVSQQFEMGYYQYFGWPVYWGGPYMWGTYPTIVRDRDDSKVSPQGEKAWDPHLRSTQDVSGYQIHATDGEIGHIEDFIIDDETWAIRYLVIDTRNWWPGKRVLVSPHWIESVSWSESTAYANLCRESLPVLDLTVSCRTTKGTCDAQQRLDERRRNGRRSVDLDCGRLTADSPDGRHDHQDVQEMIARSRTAL